MIPKRFIFYWSGTNMSWLRYISIYSAKYYNPNYEIVLYYSNEYDDLSLPERNDLKVKDNYFNKLTKVGIKVKEWEFDLYAYRGRTKKGWKYIAPAQKCDILQWQKLYQDGGIFCDSDIVFLKPLDIKYLNHDMLTCFAKYYTVGFWAAKPKLDMMMDFYSNAIFTFDENNYQTAGVSNILSVIKQKLKLISANKFKALRDAYPDVDIFNLPFNSLYRWDYNNLDKIYNKDLPLKSEQLGIHWYGGYVDSKFWINNLNETNVNQYNNTICKAIRRVL
jgi:hypothetical protein